MKTRKIQRTQYNPFGPQPKDEHLQVRRVERHISTTGFESKAWKEAAEALADPSVKVIILI
jgi:hypothetical protein